MKHYNKMSLATRIKLTSGEIVFPSYGYDIKEIEEFYYKNEALTDELLKEMFIRILRDVDLISIDGTRRALFYFNEADSTIELFELGEMITLDELLESEVSFHVIRDLEDDELQTIIELSDIG